MQSEKAFSTRQGFVLPGGQSGESKQRGRGLCWVHAKDNPGDSVPGVFPVLEMPGIFSSQGILANS